MERQRNIERERLRSPGDDSPSGDSLEQIRAEIDGLNRVADRAFDSIDSVFSHQYLEQNQQTGGQ